MSKTNWPHVLHISSHRSWRGSEQQLAGLLEELKLNDWPATILCRKHSPMRRFCYRHRIESYPFKKKGFKNMLLGWEIYKLTQKKAFDLVHVHDSDALSAAIFARRLGMRLPLMVSCPPDKINGHAWLAMRKYNHKAVKAVICPSKACRDSLMPVIRKTEVLRQINKGIYLAEQEKVEVPYGRLRREFFVPDNVSLVGNVASLTPQKDYATFLKAAKVMLEENPGLFFLIVGDGPLRAKTELQISKMGLKDQVKITGSRKDLNEVLPQLDVLMHPSLSEGQGTIIQEAFAAGVPVGAVEADGIPEMIEHRRSGMLSPPGDAQKLAENVMEIITDKALREQIVAGGREKLPGYARSTNAARFMELYLEMLERKA